MASSLELLFNHLVLPVKLPGREDTDIESIEQALFERLTNACYTFTTSGFRDIEQLFAPVAESIETANYLNQGGLDQATLLETLSAITPSSFIILYVVKQNAGLIIRRVITAYDDQVIFEAFEASAGTESVLAAEGAMKWGFPSRASSMPFSNYIDESFLSNLVLRLEQASVEALPLFSARASKAQTSVIEVRDTPNPGFITQWLMSLVEACGSTAMTPKIWKHVRDDVSIDDAELPWRRLPMWLVLRVAIQRQFILEYGEMTGQLCYKLLVTTMLSSFLADCNWRLSAELCCNLRAKISRRMEKIVTQAQHEFENQSAFTNAFKLVESEIMDSLHSATDWISSSCGQTKGETMKEVPLLPIDASSLPKESMKMQLPASGRYLSEIYNMSRLPNRIPNSEHITIPQFTDDSMTKKISDYSKTYYDICSLEDAIIVCRSQTMPGSDAEAERRCVEVAKLAEDYASAVGQMYQNDALHMSIYILNLFDLWVIADQCSIKCFPGLQYHHPGFPPRILDVLLIPLASDMQRLLEIQTYLYKRCSDSKFPMMIADSRSRDLFSSHFVRDSALMRALKLRIQEENRAAREAAELEWETFCEKFDKYSENIASYTCKCSRNPDGSTNVRGCKKCYNKRQRYKLEVTTHEDFLPPTESAQDAIVFELAIPKYLELYRQLTLRLLLLGTAKHVKGDKPPVAMLNSSHLSHYRKSEGHGTITLASESKAFGKTHYKKLRTKIGLREILRPSGLMFEYYDEKSCLWLAPDPEDISFHHLCCVKIPAALNCVFNKTTPLTKTTSYEIMASQTRCPSNMPPHEFIALQGLLSSENLRWLDLLRELGASNINFGDEDTMLAVTQICIQAGPASVPPKLCRTIHDILGDDQYCAQLSSQVASRLEDLSTNWREVYSMETVISMCLRLFQLSPPSMRNEVEKLIRKARTITLSWLTSLNQDLHSTSDSNVVESALKYGWWAALLCRHTFSYCGQFEDSALSAEDTSIYVQATIAFRDYFIQEPLMLTKVQKDLLVRDRKVSWNLSSLVERSLVTHERMIGPSINAYWGDEDNKLQRSYTTWQTHVKKHWISSTMSSIVGNGSRSQSILYNTLEGHLLVDGRISERLPLEISGSESVRELFGSKSSIHTFPSSLRGMTHQLQRPIEGQAIHFGMRENSVIIQATSREGILEFVPKARFLGKDGPDLPSSLLDNCVHWINLTKNVLEIRRKPRIWRTRSKDWVLNLSSMYMRKSGAELLSLKSTLWRTISKIFAEFEISRRLTISRTGKKLNIELKHLDLSFFVNQKGLLQCREHNFEIDEDQDAGTFYGLQSKLVLKSVINAQNRIIFVRLGTPEYEQSGAHPLVYNKGDDDRYCRFNINKDLGRLECPPDPQLLYTKALLHAVTSLPAPDALTRRTGTEEAFHILRSAYCQPWAPLQEKILTILKTIESLSPARSYYPADKRKLQSTRWNANLTSTIQHDDFGPIVRSILQQSKQLQAFSQGDNASPEPRDLPFYHLQRRGALRRNTCERSSRTSHFSTSCVEYTYTGRDHEVKLDVNERVRQLVRNVLHQNFEVDMPVDLRSILQGWQFINGFDNNEAAPCFSLYDSIEEELDKQWGSLVTFCQQSDDWDVIFRLATLLLQSKNFDHQASMVNYLTAFCCMPRLKALSPPGHVSFTDFRYNESPSRKDFLRIVEPIYPEFEPEESTDSESSDSSSENYEEAQAAHIAKCNQEGRKIVGMILRQWPCEVPSVIDFESVLLDRDSVLETILPEWQRLHANWELSNFVDTSLDIIQHCGNSSNPRTARDHFWRPSFELFHLEQSRRVPRNLAQHLLTKPFYETTLPDPVGDFEVPLAKRSEDESTLDQILSQQTTPREFRELGEILQRFMCTENELRREYAKDLCLSLHALCKSSKNVESVTPTNDVRPIKLLVRHYQNQLREEFICIRAALLADDPALEWLEAGDLLPIITPITLLEELRSISGTRFGLNMKKHLIAFGKLLTTLQRQYRLENAILAGNHARYVEEYQNVGHENWDPAEYCDWLLLEIDSSILIRKDQVDVAQAVISPSSGKNSLLQMNMGKGKTSCIMPMAAAVLGNQKNLCRVIVPSALLIQSAETLQARLGGLVGRMVRHIVYSRRTPTSKSMLSLYPSLHQDIIKSAGVLITTPDVVLSYQLSGKQCLADMKIEEAKAMIACQNWLFNVARDILDESDVSLAVKTQLIYPSGLQVAVDGGSYRWHIPQTLLGMAESYFEHVHSMLPFSIMIVKRAQGFPIAHFLKPDAEQLLCRLLIDDICDGKFVFLRSVFSAVNHTDRNLQDASAHLADQRRMSDDVRSLLTGAKLDDTVFKRILDAAGSEKAAVKVSILLLRGLLYEGILIVCLKKRWSVQYGLHLARHPMAVPFEAKGVPSEQAEFGHPDVAINLTCLAFYYYGLTMTQFTDGLKLILAADDPDSEYERWVGPISLPLGLSRCQTINTEDHIQISELWKYLRFSRPVLHHYMNNFVFPIHAKQFPYKQQASGWNLPLLHANSSSAKTTGFSGTNDNKKLLPLNIMQDNLPELHGLGAEVISYVLQQRNRKFHVAPYTHGLFNATQLLRNLFSSKNRLLIDAGALILDMSNLELVTRWLEIDYEAKAAVYFDANNKAWVKYRTRREPIPLLATPFVEDLGNCVVYLDQAHTRGVDLKFPADARGAVTLALGQTKDNTVQAIMRLRQVATTQSVVFVAPSEVGQSILDLCQLKKITEIDSSHVIFWLMEQTCQQNEIHQGLFIAQGVDYCTTKDAEWKYNNIHALGTQQSAYTQIIQRPERQSLEQLYGNEVEQVSTSQKVVFPTLDSFMKALDRVRLTAEADGLNLTTLALEEVEQEREVEHQVEEVRVIQKPPHRRALTFPGKLHHAIVDFIKEGDLVGKEGFCQAFQALSATSISKKFPILCTNSKLYVSTEYMRTVELKPKELANDKFLRPVEWIVWSEASRKALIIIPEEAELVLKLLQMTLRAKAVLIVYSTPVTKRMTHFSNLDYYVFPKPIFRFTIPDWLSVDLGIFVGKAYMKHDEVAPLTNYLKTANTTTWLGPREGGKLVSSVFTSNPHDFLVEWVALRRAGQDITHTPLGYIMQGRAMNEDHPFFSHSTPDHSESEGGSGTLTPHGSSAAETEDFEELTDDDEDDEDLEDDY